VKGEFVLRTGDESFRGTLIYSLPENIHAAIAIGGKQDVVAVGGPIRSKIVTVIECKAARVFEAVFYDVAYVHVSLHKANSPATRWR
jgi:hypothetical protein